MIRKFTIPFTLALMAALWIWACGDDSAPTNDAVCGDDVCEEGETEATCPQDCYCGNGACEETEDATGCPADCAECGDGICHDPTETCDNCPQDCGSCIECGNGIIEGDEVCDSTDLGGATCESVDASYIGGTLACTDTCTFDTAACLTAICGNDVCEETEDATSCPDDCLMSCGNALCEGTLGETCLGCPDDCTCGETDCQGFLTCMYSCDDMACAEQCHGQGCAEAQQASATVLECTATACATECATPSEDMCHTCMLGNCGAMLGGCYQSVCPGTCGDGVCDGTEDHSNCPEDCPLCGDGVCEAGEDGTSCPDDCAATCGDDYCAETETCDDCPTDCGNCPPTCGNGECDPVIGESCATCPADCACGDQTCSEVLSCLNTCTQNDQACVEACFESGCYEAQQQAQAFYMCMLTNCAAECGTDPNGTTCVQCIGTECGAEFQACNNGTCP
jgi:hypothetical protein